MILVLKSSPRVRATANRCEQWLQRLAKMYDGITPLSRDVDCRTETIRAIRANPRVHSTIVLVGYPNDPYHMFTLTPTGAPGRDIWEGELVGGHYTFVQSQTKRTEHLQVLMSIPTDVFVRDYCHSTKV